MMLNKSYFFQCFLNSNFLKIKLPKIFKLFYFLISEVQRQLVRSLSLLYIILQILTYFNFQQQCSNKQTLSQKFKSVLLLDDTSQQKSIFHFYRINCQLNLTSIRLANLFRFPYCQLFRMKHYIFLNLLYLSHIYLRQVEQIQYFKNTTPEILQI